MISNSPIDILLTREEGEDWKYPVAALIAAILMAHAGVAGEICGALIFAALVVRGFWQPNCLIYAAILSLYPLDSIPNKVGIREVTFVIAMGALFIKAALSSRDCLVLFSKKPVLYTVAGLLVFLIVNYIVASRNDVSIMEWGRGLIPFLFILVGIPLSVSLLKSPGALRALMISFLILSALFAFRTVLVFLQEELWKPIHLVLEKDTGEWVKPEGDFDSSLYAKDEIRTFLRRVTLFLPQSTSVMMILSIVWGGLGYLLIEGKARFLSLAVSMLGMVAILFTQTRSMVLTVCAVYVCIASYLLLYRRGMFRKFFALVATLLVTSIATIIIFDFGGVLSLRFCKLFASAGLGSGEYELWENEEDVNITARLEECKIAFDMFLESPVLGKGLGAKHTMLFSVWFGEILEQEVSYIHNWVLYFLSLSGVIGFLIYVWIVASPLMQVSKNNFFKSDLGLIVYTTIGSLICYALFFAVFRLIPFNLVLGSMIGIGIAMGMVRKKSELCVES